MKKSRRPFVALLLSLLCPGLGQLYCGFPRRGLFFAALSYGDAMALRYFGTEYPLSDLILLFGFISIVIWAMADAYKLAKKIGTLQLKFYNRWYFYLALYIMVLGVSTDTFPLRTYHMLAVSMSPTLIPDDYFVADQSKRRLKEIQRGDILVFPDPKNPKVDFVKRAVAFGGDIVEVQEGCKLILNGKEAEEPYVNCSATDEPAKNFGPLTVPEGKIFMLGDNRNNSADSRQLGPIDKELVKGKAKYIYWSQDKSRIGKRLD